MTQKTENTVEGVKDAVKRFPNGDVALRLDENTILMKHGSGGVSLSQKCLLGGNETARVFLNEHDLAVLKTALNWELLA